MLRVAITSSGSDCSGFSHRWGEWGSILSRPVGFAGGAGAASPVERTRTCKRDSSGRHLRSSGCSQSHKGGDMQACLKAVLLACALALSATSHGFDCFGFFGTKPCGCGNPNCCDGCEPNRWIGCGCGDDCGCEPGCGCNSSCGCSGAYCVDGRKFAGQTYNCGCDSYMPMKLCVGPDGCTSPCGCDCGDSCEASCGCEAGCGCSNDCGCEAGCGCASGCGREPKTRGCCATLLHICGRMCDTVCGGAGCGCSGEVYWSEWYNDPPRCHDPCNCCGQWVGPGAGPGRCGCGGNCGCGNGACGCGRYGSTSGNGYDTYAKGNPNSAHGGATFAAAAQPRPASAGTNVARGFQKPSAAQPRAARKPLQGSQQQLQR